ncbi:CBS domain-containing protein [Confluentibacter sediminis]|uniref:CBS domain-containing protein n=1 Tax=Confluentibacter sediminis TaxID=2219045 RepID=UPI000DADFB19|nr:CBS domain-containing protein [Confluentibacter sediminis]
MIRKIPVSAIMTQSVICLEKEDNLEDAEYLFKIHHIRHIPIVNSKSIIGMLSKTDLQRIGLWNDSEDEKDSSMNALVRSNKTIEEVMTKKLTCVSSSTSVKKVAEIFAKEEFHALPIVDNNILIGIVTTTDLINFLLKQF